MKFIYLVLLFSFSFITSTHAESVASTNKAEHTLKSKPVTGSKIPKVIARASIPFDKSYAQLTSQQKQRVLALYPNLSKTATPPFPRVGLKAISKPLLQAGSGSGLLSFVAKIDTFGQINEITILQSPSKQTAVYTKQLLRRIKFDPATDNGNPITAEFRYKMLFN